MLPSKGSDPHCALTSLLLPDVSGTPDTRGRHPTSLAGAWPLQTPQGFKDCFALGITFRSRAARAIVGKSLLFALSTALRQMDINGLGNKSSSPLFWEDLPLRFSASVRVCVCVCTWVYVCTRTFPYISTLPGDAWPLSPSLVLVAVASRWVKPGFQTVLVPTFQILECDEGPGLA